MLDYHNLSQLPGPRENKLTVCNEGQFGHPFQADLIQYQYGPLLTCHCMHTLLF